MNDFLKVEGHDGLVRDMSSKAIINTNKKQYEEYVARRDAARRQKEQIERQAEEINNVKNDLSEIKELLLTLLSRK